MKSEKEKKNNFWVYLAIALLLLIIFGSFVYFGITGNIIYNRGDYSGTDFAPPLDVFDSNNLIFNVSPENLVVDDSISSIDFNVSVFQPGAFIYKTAYYFDNGLQSWVPFNFSQETIGSSNWILSSADAPLPVSFSSLKSGNNLVAVYSCKKIGDSWECGCQNSEETNCRRWMLQMVNVTKGCVNRDNCGSNEYCSRSTCVLVSANVLSLSSCGVLNTSGTYLLLNDLASSSTCLTINSSGVEIEGNGHIITGNIDSRIAPCSTFACWNPAAYNLNVNNLVLNGNIYSQGAAGFGGGNGGDIKIIDSNISGNVYSDGGYNSGGGTSHSGKGGKIEVYDSFVNYLSNSAGGCGNVCDVPGDIIISSSQVNNIVSNGGSGNNYPSRGGQVILLNSFVKDIVVQGGNFLSSSYSGNEDGGVLNLSNSRVCSFTRNSMVCNLGSAWGSSLVGKTCSPPGVSNPLRFPVNSNPITQINSSISLANCYSSTLSFQKRGLVAYYPLDTNTLDYSGNGNNATNNGAIPTSGKVGGAYLFNGAPYPFKGAANNLDVSFVLPRSNFTISAWIKPAVLNQNNGFIIYIGNEYPGPGVGYGIGGGDNYGDVLNSKLMGVEASYTWMYGNYNFTSLNKWSQVSMVHRADGVYEYYVDGNLTSNSSSKLASGNFPSKVKIGSGVVPGMYWGRYFNGSIDELSVWNRSLSSEEISALYNSGNGLSLIGN